MNTKTLTEEGIQYVLEHQLENNSTILVKPVVDFKRIEGDVVITTVRMVALDADVTIQIYDEIAVRVGNSLTLNASSRMPFRIRPE